MKRVQYAARMDKSAQKVLERKTELMRQRGTPRSEWDDIKADLKERGRGEADWIHLA